MYQCLVLVVADALDVLRRVVLHGATSTNAVAHDSSRTLHGCVPMSMPGPEEFTNPPKGAFQGTIMGDRVLSLLQVGVP